jgi:hypothetical protein
LDERITREIQDMPVSGYGEYVKEMTPRAPRPTVQPEAAPASSKGVSEWDDNSIPLLSLANKPTAAVATSSNSLWNRIGSIDETLVPGVGWLSREQAVSSSQTWRDKLDGTGNPTYAVLQGVADLWADHADEVTVALSMGKGLTPIKAGEVTTYKNFADRSVIGDSIEGSRGLAKWKSEGERLGSRKTVNCGVSGKSCHRSRPSDPPRGDCNATVIRSQDADSGREHPSQYVHPSTARGRIRGDDYQDRSVGN